MVLHLFVSTRIPPSANVQAWGSLLLLVLTWQSNTPTNAFAESAYWSFLSKQCLFIIPNIIRVFPASKLYILYQILRFLSFVPTQILSCQRPRMNQRRTKDEPKNSEIEKVLFVKIAVSFPSLIPCLIPPREHRPTTERRATQLPMNKKCVLLRLAS